MMIPCPHCGARGNHEFITRGDAKPKRPSGDAGEEAFFEFAYMRDNPAGEIDEYWYHAQGCRTWLIVRRDTRTHAILSARPAGTP
jgi:methylglutamate dehydrogenase subunit B